MKQLVYHVSFLFFLLGACGNDTTEINKPKQSDRILNEEPDICVHSWSDSVFNLPGEEFTRENAKNFETCIIRNLKQIEINHENRNRIPDMLNFVCKKEFSNFVESAVSSILIRCAKLSEALKQKNVSCQTPSKKDWESLSSEVINFHIERRLSNLC